MNLQRATTRLVAVQRVRHRQDGGLARDDRDWCGITNRPGGTTTLARIQRRNSLWQRRFGDGADCPGNERAGLGHRLTTRNHYGCIRNR